MRAFYLAWPVDQIVQTLSAQSADASMVQTLSALSAGRSVSTLATSNGLELGAIARRFRYRGPHTFDCSR